MEREPTDVMMDGMPFGIPIITAKLAETVGNCLSQYDCCEIDTMGGNLNIIFCGKGTEIIVEAKNYDFVIKIIRVLNMSNDSEDIDRIFYSLKVNRLLGLLGYDGPKMTDKGTTCTYMWTKKISFLDQAGMINGLCAVAKRIDTDNFEPLTGLRKCVKPPIPEILN